MQSGWTLMLARAVAVVCLVTVFIAALMVGASAQTAGDAMLTGNHPDEVRNLRPAAHADPLAPLQMQMTLALRNRAALDQLLNDQRNPASPHYHQWLTPAQFAARFGPAQRDLDAVAQWLGAQGFKVTSTSLARRSVLFNGTVSDAERAFATNIMTFGDGTSYSNVTDPVIPARFSGVVSAIGGLDNFLHSFALHRSSSASPQTASTDWTAAPAALLDSGPALSMPDGGVTAPSPEVTIGGITSFGPSDFRSFYNENPLISGGITGAGGDCLAIVGTSDFAPGAVSLFNSTFSLPASSITTVLTDGTNPGFNDAQDEAQLDLEWSHAVAPGAATRFYLGNNSSSTSKGSIVDSIEAAVDDNLCGVISVSFSLCGGSMAFFTGVVSPIYAQMATQGQSIFISSGDQGAAGVIFSGGHCAFGTSRNINELGGDANVTQVGGTGFTPKFNFSGDNVGHVAESVWNDSVAHTGGGSTGGGASVFYAKPSYQKGPGVPNDGQRDVPDIALIASPYNPGAFWGSVSGGSPIINCCIGGTSLSAPAWAGIAKLMAQLSHARTGPLNPRIYALANAGAATSGFRDVTTGNNNFNGVTGFIAGPGFDLDTGWGTVDITTFANDYVAPPSPAISSVPSIIRVGSSFTIDGSFFSPGAKVNFFVATSIGSLNAGPLTPSFVSSTHMVVPVPATVPLGQGFVSVQVVNADLGFKSSNPASALLQGSAAAGIPSLTSINGMTLAATSHDAHFATNNVETVIIQGTSVTLGGSGFDAAHGVAVNVFCACPGGKVGPILVNPGSGGLTPTSFSFTLPASVKTGPASIVVINKGADASFSKSSNAVSVPVGAAITVASVTPGSTITVDGTGFSTLTVINLFNKKGATTVNLGGLGAGGVPKIHLTVINSTRFTFAKPAAAVPGPSYVQGFNPPFVPFTSSGTGPGGAFTMP